MFFYSILDICFYDNLCVTMSFLINQIKEMSSLLRYFLEFLFRGLIFFNNNSEISQKRILIKLFCI